MDAQAKHEEIQTCLQKEFDVRAKGIKMETNHGKYRTAINHFLDTYREDGLYTIEIMFDCGLKTRILKGGGTILLIAGIPGIPGKAIQAAYERTETNGHLFDLAKGE